MVLTKKAVKVMMGQVNSIKGVEIPLFRRAGIVLIDEVGVNREVVQEIRNQDKEDWRGLEVGLRTGRVHDLEVDPLAKRVPGSIVDAEVDLWENLSDSSLTLKGISSG